MLEALAEAVMDETKKHYKIGGHLEGHPHDGWMVIDYGDIVVHLFTEEQRNYYQLEDLWSTGKVLLHLQ
jgi:ribosome-associated protein